MPEPTAEASSSKQPKASKQKAPKPAADGAAAPAPGAAGGKSAKDIKKEKRAAAVAARGGGVNPKDIPPESGASGPGAVDMPATPTSAVSGRPSGPQRTGTGAGGMPIAGGGGGGGGGGDGLARRPVMMTAETGLTFARPIMMEEQFFGHLPKSVPAHSEDAVKGGKVHPLVIRLGVMMASGELRGANARTHALMIAFREVIRDYVSPDNADLWKDLPVHLSPNIVYLEGCRPKGVGGGNAIRWLKQEITRLGENEGEDQSEAEQKSSLIAAIDGWIAERLTAADDLIAENAKDKIQPGDVVVTFARSSLVEKTLLTAWKDMRERNYQDSFTVVVVDSHPLLEGRELLSSLTKHSIPCTYTPLSSLPSTLPSASLVLLGGSAVFANGALLSRAGTAQVAMLAKEFRVPVVACVETYKFADVTRLDGLGSNEVYKKAEIRHKWEATGAERDRRVGNGRTVEWGREWAEEEDGVGGGGKEMKDEANLAKGGKKKGTLSSLALLYDLTPADYITAVCTEVGLIPPRSGPTVTGKSSGVV